MLKSGIVDCNCGCVCVCVGTCRYIQTLAVASIVVVVMMVVMVLVVLQLVAMTIPSILQHTTVLCSSMPFLSFDYLYPHHRIE